MHRFNEWLLWLDGLLGSAAYFPYLLIGVGVFFTLYLGFPQIRYFNHAWKVVSGRYDDRKAPGDTSHFQALATALSGTVGTGNISGVALAIYFGGPAALFWMWVTAFFGMTTKFVEVTLSHKYRVKTEDGTMAGGPMYYMDRRLKMKWLAILFAIATVICSFGTGNMPQINSIASAMERGFGLEPAITAGVLAVILALVILGGIRRIALVASRLVPAMACVYLFGALAVIIQHYDNILPSLASVFADAFTGSAAVGGFLGASFAYAFNRGVARGLFSNEAGQGSAPIAHASAKAHEPVSEGIVALLEPFIDTLVICTITGLVILASGVWTEKHQNQFQSADLVYIQGQWSDTDDGHRLQLGAWLTNQQSDIAPYSGSLMVVDGVAQPGDYTLIHARSVAEEVRYSVAGHPLDGELMVVDGKLANSEVTLNGLSRVHSAQLTAIAFTRSFIGSYGQQLLALSLLLFAFSTTISWSYYGDRAVQYLLGYRAIMPYRVLYVAGFVWAALSDTTTIWNLAGVAVVLMTLPNLLGIMLLHREMKETVHAYWRGLRSKGG